MNEYRRKTPEELLRSIHDLHRGRLNIYIGSVSGSGKTYHMLREGHTLKKSGVDVVYCAVSTLRRPDTVQQLEGLERIDSMKWDCNSVEKKDLNIEAIVERNPEVVLTDGLAHRNRHGAPRATRLEDIRYLQSLGISVMVTVNVYDLEGVRELAKKRIGLEAAETVPDDILEQADEVRLIDVSPETMLKRMSDGSLGEVMNKTLFRRGNLAVLRELALRLMAEGVNDSLERHREEEGLEGPSGVTERILVSTQYHWNGSIYVRRGQQIAKRLNGELSVVAFVKPGIKLSTESEAFRHSMKKLCKKIDAAFSELPFRSRRKLPEQLLKHAREVQATRIVLGHSKQTTWQDLIRGSVIHGLLWKMREVDLFIVADRAELDGERILPAKTADAEDRTGHYRRLSAAQIEEKTQSIRRGKFKVFIGAAPGVGKTYAMLREGNSLLQEGVNVIIGLLETHGRKETLEQVGALSKVPLKVIDYRGATLQEMDRDEIIRLHPEVVLVDELAHTNVPSSINKKRYEDVLEILQAGISVISTMNVQHLESLNDAVEGVTGVRVRETVPDSILRYADEVELIDVAPTALRQRLRDGKVYALDKVEQSLNHFFKVGNLIALRELALREIADDVDERLEAWERTSSLRGPWRRKESICVFVSLSDHAERLIRRGFRIAHRLKATWHTVYIQPYGKEECEIDQLRVEAIQALTERLGGVFVMHEAGMRYEIGREIVDIANRLGCSQLVLGQTKQPWWKRWLSGSTMNVVVNEARAMDVLVVAQKRHVVK
ncbi:universal stress protein [Paenibacillus sp. L3-i20]|uniref:universal stress protein n=1 Tax=Paenibacillus sp. L3-i20 TaxID=2905833 RepID=UPI001EDD86D9|nr:universal stress protein [Paenibacillus sp. L3-i20]GKU76443.1 potassium-transporting P-type ATPase D chain [Paenibacillus sp. L3-i20]